MNRRLLATLAVAGAALALTACSAPTNGQASPIDSGTDYSLSPSCMSASSGVRATVEGLTQLTTWPMPTEVSGFLSDVPDTGYFAGRFPQGVAAFIAYSPKNGDGSTSWVVPINEVGTKMLATLSGSQQVALEGKSPLMGYIEYGDYTDQVDALTDCMIAA